MASLAMVWMELPTPKTLCEGDGQMCRVVANEGKKCCSLTCSVAYVSHQVTISSGWYFLLILVQWYSQVSLSSLSSLSEKNAMLYIHSVVYCFLLIIMEVMECCSFEGVGTLSLSPERDCCGGVVDCSSSVHSQLLLCLHFDS